MTPVAIVGAFERGQFYVGCIQTGQRLPAGRSPVGVMGNGDKWLIQQPRCSTTPASRQSPPCGQTTTVNSCAPWSTQS